MERQRTLAMALEKARAPIVRGTPAKSPQCALGHEFVEPRECLMFVGVLCTRFRNLKRIGRRRATSDAPGSQIKAATRFTEIEGGARDLRGNRPGRQVVGFGIDHPA